MKAHYLVSATYLTDPELSQFIPREVRKTLRITRKAVKENKAGTSLTDYLSTDYRADAYHNQNLTDPDPYADEFGDIDNEYEGLTITEPMTSEAELWQFCTGYDVI